jgi:large subunit ribosomal protein L32
MPLPGNRVSKQKGRSRRAHYKLTKQGMGSCSHCGQPKLSHHVCTNCGYYAGREVLRPKL